MGGPLGRRELLQTEPNEPVFLLSLIRFYRVFPKTVAGGVDEDVLQGGPGNGDGIDRLAQFVHQP